MSRFEDHLEKLLARGSRHRSLPALEAFDPRLLRLAGRELLNFSSNDYLALSRLPLKERGGSQPSSRLLGGNLTAHLEVERRLAEFMDAEAALLLPTGYMANVGLLSALAGRGDVLLLDRACHASLVDGARLSGGRIERFRHNDFAALVRRLERLASDHAGAIFVVVESLYSMDGDTPDFAALAALKKRHGFFLVVDEAHAIGLHGPQGRGLLAAQHCRGLAEAVIFTLSKAFALQGGVIAGSARLKDLLVNRCRPLIYSTALPAGRVVSVLNRIEAILAADAARRKLEDLCRVAEHTLGLARQVWSPIFPIVVGQGEDARRAAAQLLEAGIYCPAVLPPTVPEGSARLRVSLNAAHENEDLERLNAGLVKLGLLSDQGGPD